MKNRPFKQKFDRYFQEIRYWLYQAGAEENMLTLERYELEGIVHNSPGSPSLEGMPSQKSGHGDRTATLGMALGEFAYREKMLAVVEAMEASEHGPLIDAKRDCFPRTRGRRANTHIKRKLAHRGLYIEESTIDKQWRQCQLDGVMLCLERGLFKEGMRTRYEERRAQGAKHLSGI
ncbi:MAG: hypothetical protein Q8J63_00745 [Candidatus Aquicultor sp.]|nr:hypothetical protein [Candidatus Aquicultor sp.]